MPKHAHLTGITARTVRNPHRISLIEGAVGDDAGGDHGGENQKPRAERTDAERGYPSGTPVEQMDPTQQAAYWRDQSKKHEGMLKAERRARGDYDAVKAKADEYDRVKSEQQTEQEKAVTAAREEGRQAAIADANRMVATAIYRAGLDASGVDSADIDDLVAAFNPDAFITSGDVDTDKVSALASRFGRGGTATQPDMGQGRGTGHAPAGRAGIAEAHRRFGKPA